MKYIVYMSFLLLFISCKNNNSKQEIMHSKPSSPKDLGPAIDQAAELLINARMQNELIDLPDAISPQNLDQGYKIQERIIETIHIPQLGWKVAITSDELMQKAGIKEPVYGPLFEKWTAVAPVSIRDGAPTLYGVEFEFAFKLAHDLPARNERYTEEEVKAAVASMHLAIEPVGTRYKEGPAKSGVAKFAADHGGNYGFIYGPKIANWQSLDLTQIEVIGYSDDEIIGREFGSNVMGNPLHSLTWLANKLQQRGHYLKAGQWITTGAVVGPITIQPPAKIHGQYGQLGAVHFDFKG